MAVAGGKGQIVAECAGGDPDVVLWNRPAFLFEQSFNNAVPSRGFQIVRGQGADLYETMDSLAVSFSITGLFGSEEELSDDGQREECLHSAALTAAKIHLLVEHSDGYVGIEQVPTTHGDPPARNPPRSLPSSRARLRRSRRRPLEADPRPTLPSGGRKRARGPTRQLSSAGWERAGSSRSGSVL